MRRLFGLLLIFGLGAWFGAWAFRDVQPRTWLTVTPRGVRASPDPKGGRASAEPGGVCTSPPMTAAGAFAGMSSGCSRSSRPRSISRS